MVKTEKEKPSVLDGGRERPSILEKSVRKQSIANKTRQNYDTDSAQRSAKSAKPHGSVAKNELAPMPESDLDSNYHDIGNGRYMPR